ncbi:MAG: YihY/virulence factor BrkB family protein [Cyclobacteriaceae bacterium]
MINKFKELQRFLHEDLWKVKVTSLPRGKAFLYRQLRILMITFSEFQKDKCSEKASALTYFTMLSIVPVVAMAYGISTAFGMEDYLKSELRTFLAGQPEEVVNNILEWSTNMLSGASGGLISGISSVFLIYAVARLLNEIEVAFNDIWGTEKGRSLKRKLTDYMSVIFLGPLILILSGTVTVFITSQMEIFTQSLDFLGFVKPGILFLIRLIPYTLVWFLLFLVYIVFPNAPVKIKAALLAGIIAGSFYQLLQLGWIEGQVFLSKYNAIYGTFAALPLFLIWLQLSWMILLFGAELAFAIQNVTTWAYDNEDLNINLRTRRKLTLLIMKHVIKDFEKWEGPVSFSKLTTDLVIPHRFVREAVSDLENAGLIIRVKNDDEEQYVPGMDINKIDIATVINKLEDMGLNNLPQQHQNKEFAAIDRTISSISETIRKAPANKLLKEL